MKKDIKTAGLPIGGASLLMAFVLLCLSTFAVISYMAALQDYRFSKKTAENITSYYIADAEAEEVLAKILPQVKKNPYELEKIWSNYDMKVVEQEKDIVVKFDVPIKETMILQGVISFPKNQEGYKILAWKQRNTLELEDNPIFLDLPLF